MVTIYFPLVSREISVTGDSERHERMNKTLAVEAGISLRRHPVRDPGVGIIPWEL